MVAGGLLPQQPVREGHPAPALRDQDRPARASATRDPGAVRGDPAEAGGGPDGPHEIAGVVLAAARGARVPRDTRTKGAVQRGHTGSAQDLHRRDRDERQEVTERGLFIILKTTRGSGSSQDSRGVAAELHGDHVLLLQQGTGDGQLEMKDPVVVQREPEADGRAWSGRGRKLEEVITLHERARVVFQHPPDGPLLRVLVAQDEGLQLARLQKTPVVSDHEVHISAMEFHGGPLEQTSRVVEYTGAGIRVTRLDMERKWVDELRNRDTASNRHHGTHVRQ